MSVTPAGIAGVISPKSRGLVNSRHNQTLPKFAMKETRLFVEPLTGKIALRWKLFAWAKPS
jgi:hypothetical protein